MRLLESILTENVPSAVLRGIVLAVEKAMAKSPLLTVLGVPVRASPNAPRFAR